MGFRDMTTKHKITIPELVKRGITAKTVHKLLKGTHRFDLAMVSRVEVTVNEIVAERLEIKLIDIPKRGK